MRAQRLLRCWTPGGWGLHDPRPIQEANPETFWLPDPSEIEGLRPGSSARLIFEVLSLADRSIDGESPYGADGSPNLVVARERMWTVITARQETPSGIQFVGVLQNQPVARWSRLMPGVQLTFPASHIIDFDPDFTDDIDEFIAELQASEIPVVDKHVANAPLDSQFMPSFAPSQLAVCERVGVRPEPVALPCRYLCSTSALSGELPIHGARYTPNEGQADSGWMIWSDSQAHDPAAGDYAMVNIWEMGEVFSSLKQYFALPPGWSFVHGESGYQDVYFDPGVLE